MTEDLLEKHKVKSPLTTNAEMEEIYKKKQARGDKKAKGQEYANWASLGMALLGGVTGDANMEYAAQGQLASGLLQKNASDVAEESVEDMKMKRLLAKESLLQKAASGASPKPVLTKDPTTGKAYWASAADAPGREAFAPRETVGEKLAFKQGEANININKRDKTGENVIIKTDKLGNMFAVDKGRRSVRMLKKALQEKGIPSAKADQVGGFVKDYNRDTKPIREKSGLLKDSILALKTSTKLGNKIGLQALIKTIEGRMTDADRDYYQSRTGWRKVGDWFVAQKTGDKVPPETLKELKILLGDMLISNRERIGSLRKERIGQTSSIFKVPIEDLEGAFGTLGPAMEHPFKDEMEAVEAKAFKPTWVVQDGEEYLMTSPELLKQALAEDAVLKGAK